MEMKRPTTGLVKVLCLSYNRRVGDRHHRRHKETTRKPANFEELLGTKSWVNSFYVWFPAAWMPLVVEAIEKKTCEFLQGNQQPGAVSCIADVQTLIGENREVCIRVQIGMQSRRSIAGSYMQGQMLTTYS